MKNHNLNNISKLKTLIVMLLLIFFLPLGSIAQDFWEATGSIPIDGSAYRIETDSQDRIFLGINNAGIYLSTDNGNSWTLKGLTGLTIMDMAINDADQIFAVGGQRVFRSLNNGNTWVNVSAGLPGVDIYSITIDADGRIFVGLYGQMIYRSIDNGTTWEALSNGLSNQTVYTVLAVNSLGHIFAGTNGAHFYRSTDQGNSWQRFFDGLSSPAIWALEVDSEDRIFAGTENGICISNNNGQSWSLAPQTEGNFDVNDMTINSSDHVFATNFHGGVWTTSDHGTTWSELEDPVVGQVSWGLGMSSDDYLLCGLGNSQVYKSKEPTVSSSTLFTSISANLQAIGNSSVEWGDYDNDGDLDILAIGRDDASNYAKIYRNDGSGTFTDLQSPNLQAVINGPVSWGDYDNDGDLDILMTGYDGGSTNFSILYRNDGEGIFTDQTIDLQPIGSGYVEWVDYDNDGDLDIFMSGWNGSTSFALIYRNDSGIFTDINAGLPGVRSGASPWGDYDNDGDLDILLTGWDGENRFSQIFRNDSGSFTDIQAGLTLVAGAAAWGDYDSDGDLDLILTGYSNDSSFETIFYENDAGLFFEVNLNLPRVNRGTVDWGDYDNDGDLDILLTGNDGTQLVADIFQNDGGTFTAIGAGLQAVSNSAVAFGDYDNDGALDILLTGNDGTNFHSIIYKNSIERLNTVPSAPGNLTHTTSGSAVTLGWESAADIETSNNALTYNIRIGTSFGAEDVKTAQSNLTTGLRKLVSTGNVQQVTSWTIQALAAGTYYWSVQAIDNAYAGSQFSVEQSFVIGGMPMAITDNASNVGTTTVTLNATVNPNNLTTTVVFEYGLSDSYGNQTTATQSPLNGTSDLVVNADLSGLVEGEQYHYRVVATNGVGVSYGSDQYFTTNMGGSLPTTTTNSVSGVTLISAILNGTVNPGDLSTAVFFEYGVTTAYGAQVSASVDPLIGDVDIDVSAGLIELSENTEYHYRLVASNAIGTSNGTDQVFTTLMNYPVSYALSATSDPFPVYENAEDYLASDYRLVGLPGSSTLKANNLLEGTLGDDWQVYWDNGNADEYLVEFDGSSQFEFGIGQAFWLINKGPFDIDASVNSAPLNADSQIEIPLHSGWNLITNPLVSSISWSTIQQLNDISEPIWGYDGSFSQSDTLESYKGYYLFNTNDLNDLKVHYQSNDLAKTPPENDRSDQWQVHIELQTAGQGAGSIYLGVSEAAELGQDQFDHHKPRAVGDITSVSFNRPDWDENFSTFASDIRPAIELTEAWDFELNNLGSELAKLTFLGIDQVPAELAVALINPLNGISHDLREISYFEFSPSQSSMNFTLAVGYSEQVDKFIKALLPETLILASNYPNPFNPTTTIRYAIPSESAVSLHIFDISGRQVNTLVQTVQSAGWYTAQWGGTTSNGSPVEAGIYFAQIQAGNFSQVIRMVYLP